MDYTNCYWHGNCGDNACAECQHYDPMDSGADLAAYQSDLEMRHQTYADAITEE